MVELARRTATHDTTSLLGGVRLEELPPPAMVNLRGTARDPAFVRAAGAALGCVLPGSPNSVETAGGRQVVWLGPDEWLVLGEGGREAALEASLVDALAGQHVSVVDVSGNRALLRLSGPGARSLLESGCSLDLHPRAFGPGRAAQTLVARAQVLLIQRDEVPTYDVLPRRSFATYLRTWFEDGGALL